MTAQRELAEKINGYLCHRETGDPNAGNFGKDDIEALITEATATLVKTAGAIDDLDDGDQRFAWEHTDEFNALNTELARWRQP